MVTTRVLASGAIAVVDDGGHATIARCPWLIQVASGNPEPDFPSDCWTEIECGAILRFDAPDGQCCEAGHEFGNMERRYAPFGSEWEREARERFAETGSVL